MLILAPENGIRESKKHKFFSEPNKGMEKMSSPKHKKANLHPDHAAFMAMVDRVTPVIHGMASSLQNAIFDADYSYGIPSYYLYWTGLNSRLQREEQKIHCYTFPDWKSGQKKLVFGDELDQRLIKMFKSRIGSIKASEAKRQALLDAGPTKTMRLDPVLTWHLADQGICQEAFKAKVLNSETRDVEGMDIAVNNDLILCTLNLSDDVTWSKGVIKMKNMTLPTIMLGHYDNRPVREIVDHPALEGVTVLRVESNVNKTRKNNVVVYTDAAAA